MNIKELRTALGMTQEQFAKHIGVHPITVSHWETGKFDPNRWLAEEIKKIETKMSKSLIKDK